MNLHLTENPRHRPIFIGLRPIEALTSDVIFEYMEMVQQSTTVFSTANVLGVKASIIHGSRIGGSVSQKGKRQLNFDELRNYKKKSIIDTKCKNNRLPIAILFGKLILDLEVNPQLRDVQLKSLKRCPVKLNREVVKFAKNVMGNDFRPDGKYGTEFISQFLVKYGSSYRVTVYNNPLNYKETEYRSQKTELNKDKNINLFFNKENGHYFCIKNIKGFFNYRQYCSDCDLMFKNPYHTCEKKLMRFLLP